MTGGGGGGGGDGREAAAAREQAQAQAQERVRVLVVGGSGYLGQHLLASLAGLDGGAVDVGFTYRSLDELASAATTSGSTTTSTTSTSAARNSASGGGGGTPPPLPAEPFQVDLVSGDGLREAVGRFAPHVVVNCAAVSQPAACERDYPAARALNVPSTLVAALQQQKEAAALLVHLSTDQVYDGTRPGWREADAAAPVNAYGRSKAESETFLSAAWPGRYVVLRSSLIYGPPPPFAAVPRPLFVQFVEAQLRAGHKTSFFSDEFRSAVFVGDICEVVRRLIQRYRQQRRHEQHHPQQQQQQLPTPTRAADAAAAAAAMDAAAVARAATEAAASPRPCVLAQLPHSVYNLGGPERLSRVDMARAVAAHCGLGDGAVVEARSSDVERGYASPPDISMDVSRLLADFPGLTLTRFADGLRQVFPPS